MQIVNETSVLVRVQCRQIGAYHRSVSIFEVSDGTRGMQLYYKYTKMCKPCVNLVLDSKRMATRQRARVREFGVRCDNRL